MGDVDILLSKLLVQRLGHASHTVLSSGKRRKRRIPSPCRRSRTIYKGKEQDRGVSGKSGVSVARENDDEGKRGKDARENERATSSELVYGEFAERQDRFAGESEAALDIRINRCI